MEANPLEHPILGFLLPGHSAPVSQAGEGWGSVFLLWSLSSLILCQTEPHCHEPPYKPHFSGSCAGEAVSQKYTEVTGGGRGLLGHSFNRAD